MSLQSTHNKKIRKIIIIIVSLLVVGFFGYKIFCLNYTCPQYVPPAPGFCKDGFIVPQKGICGCPLPPKCERIHQERPASLCPRQLGTPGIPSMPNPAAVYCKSLGYKYENGTCEFPDATECDGWEFFTGKCGKKWTYCERYGNGKIETTKEGCAFSQECALCVLSGGTKCYEWDFCSGKCP